jgi:hypothetical protein
MGRLERFPSEGNDYTRPCLPVRVRHSAGCRRRACSTSLKAAIRGFKEFEMVAGFHRNVLSIYRGPLLGHCRDRQVSTSRHLLSQAGLHGN